MSEHKNKKRTGAVARLVIWSVVAGVLTAVLAVGLMPHAIFGDGVIHFGNQYKGTVGASAQTGDGTVSEAIRRLNVDWVDGSVTLCTTDADTLTIREALSDGSAVPEEFRMRWKAENGTLKVDYCQPIRWLQGKSKALVVEIPVAWLTDLERMSVCTVSGDVKAEAVEAQGLSIETVSGDVTASGTVNWADFDSVSGKMSWNGVAHSVDAESVWGDVELSFTSTPKDVKTETVSGDVTLTLPQDIAGLMVESDLSRKHLTIDFEGTWRGDTFVFGDGSTEIDVDSLSGDVKITCVD